MLASDCAACAFQLPSGVDSNEGGIAGCHEPGADGRKNLSCMSCIVGARGSGTSDEATGAAGVGGSCDVDGDTPRLPLGHENAPGDARDGESVAWEDDAVERAEDLDERDLVERDLEDDGPDREGPG